MGSMEEGSKYECLLFDMDDTLYPVSTGLNLECRKNIKDYMVQHLNIEDAEASRLCLDLYREYGTTMAGLKAIGYEFNNDDYHAFVHGRLPYDERLKPDRDLRNLLLTIPQRKIIFTNADKEHAAQVLKRLELEGCFESIICFETLNPPVQSDDYYLEEPDQAAFFTESESDIEDIATDYSRSTNDSPKSQKVLCKPSLEAIKAAIRIAKVDPQETIFFDDSARNIASGKIAGLHTVLVGNSELVEGADYALESIHNITEILPEIWEGDEGNHSENFLQNTTVKTVVLV